MGEKKKHSNMTTLMGAAFLMATSAIGPGFLTQTSTFTAQYKSIFALDPAGCDDTVEYLVGDRCVRHARTGYCK